MGDAEAWLGKRRGLVDGSHLIRQKRQRRMEISAFLFPMSSQPTVIYSQQLSNSFHHFEAAWKAIPHKNTMHR